MSTIKISKNKLVELYTQKKLSSYQIARKLNCSQWTVMNRLFIYKIPTRTIQQGKALTPPKYKRIDFNGTLEEKAYLIGFRLGDLHVRKTHPDSPTINVNSNSTKKEQVELFRKLFSKYSHVNENGPDKRGAIKSRCYLNKSFDFLLPKTSKVPFWILKSKKNSISFFVGYIDAEATFSINHRNQPVFAIHTQDKEILKTIQSKILPSIGIETKFHFVRSINSVMCNVTSNKDVFRIQLYNKNDLNKLLKTVLPLIKHEKRKVDALEVLNLINKDERS